MAMPHRLSAVRVFGRAPTVYSPRSSPPAQRHKFRSRVFLDIGEPIDVSTHGPATSGRARRLATDEIMAAIHALSGQELAGVYNEPPAQTPIEKIRQALPHERR